MATIHAPADLLVHADFVCARLMPFIFRMSGWLYLVVAVGCGLQRYGWRLLQLLRCPGTQDISVFFNSPVGAVCCWWIITCLIDGDQTMSPPLISADSDLRR
jgi:hypothetical protein